MSVKKEEEREITEVAQQPVTSNKVSAGWAGSTLRQMDFATQYK